MPKLLFNFQHQFSVGDQYQSEEEDTSSSSISDLEAKICKT